MSTAKSDVPGEALEAAGPSAWDRRAIGFLFWLIGSALACGAICVLFPPLYRAESTIRIEPNVMTLFAAPGADRPPIDRIIETEMAEILSNRVLEAALAYPAIASLSLIRDAPDKLQAVRSRLEVANPPNSAIVRIALEAEEPKDAATIVDAVAQHYLVMHKETTSNRNYHMILRFKSYLDGLRHALDERYEQLLKASTPGGEDVKLRTDDKGPKQPAPRIAVRPPGEVPDEPMSFRALDEDQYRRAADRLLQADLDLMEARTQPGDDPAREARIAGLEAFRTRLREVLAAQARPLPSDKYKIDAIRQEIQALARQRDVVNERYEDMNFARESGLVDVELLDKAATPTAPISDDRLAYTILASVALLILAASDALARSAAVRRARAEAPAHAAA